MALFQFLEANRSEILRNVEQRLTTTNAKGTAAEIMESLPELFDDLVAALRDEAGLARETEPTSPEKSATSHGAQRLRLGFSISELVHDYGSICFEITELAEKNAWIAPHEYQVLNQVLDAAIAAAVTEFSSQRERERDREADERATRHLGFVAHELRNAISSAILSFEAIRRGRVGIVGRTSSVLERSLLRLRALIDKSLTDVRLKSGAELTLEPTTLTSLLEEVEASAAVDAQPKSIRIAARAHTDLKVNVDRQLIASALGNLLQNAIKFSHEGAVVHLRTGSSDGCVVVEVEDECGGIADAQIPNLFSPFACGAGATGGLGLGLAIARRAVEAHGGSVEFRNLPGKGCIFVVKLPANPS